MISPQLICLAFPSIFLDALASLDFKLSVSGSGMFLQLAHLRVFQIFFFCSKDIVLFSRYQKDLFSPKKSLSLSSLDLSTYFAVILFTTCSSWSFPFKSAQSSIPLWTVNATESGGGIFIAALPKWFPIQRGPNGENHVS